MSDTPRMKAAQRIESECKVKEIWRVGCQLERELNAANESLRKLNIHTLNLVDRIKRLEEAGDALYENSDPTKWDLPEANARKLKEQEAWRKAKNGNQQ